MNSWKLVFLNSNQLLALGIYFPGCFPCFYLGEQEESVLWRFHSARRKILNVPLLNVTHLALFYFSCLGVKCFSSHSTFYWGICSLNPIIKQSLTCTRKRQDWEFRVPWAPHLMKKQGNLDRWHGFSHLYKPQCQFLVSSEGNKILLKEHGESIHSHPLASLSFSLTCTHMLNSGRGLCMIPCYNSLFCLRRPGNPASVL